ncbi:hypothetical protein V2J09_000092 [Rumex salicifolius]
MQSTNSNKTFIKTIHGQFVTEIDDEKHQSFVFVDCNKGIRTKFIHTILDGVTVDDIVSPTYVPQNTVQPSFN